MKVTSLEISKKLVEIGFEAETYMKWVEYQKYDRDKQIILRHDDEWLETWETVNNICGAYDLERLLSALPKRIIKNDKELYLMLAFNDKDEIYNNMIGYYSDLQDSFIISGHGSSKTTLTDRAGILICKLHEAKLIKFEE